MTVALKRSTDRKVANAVSSSGKPLIANTFGLPAGSNYSCSGATSICSKVCYAGKLEKIYVNVKTVLLHNYNTLINMDLNQMVYAINQMIDEFEAECDKREADKLFRIHWDGDFFSNDYAQAWSLVIANHPDVTFWCYTRVTSAAILLSKAKHDNLSLYFSVDNDNQAAGLFLRTSLNIKLAWLGDTFTEGQAKMKEATGHPGGRCPEQLGRIPLISSEGSACVRCGLCVKGKADIVFSASKK